MTQAERRRLLSRRRQWQRFRTKLLTLGINYDNPPGMDDEQKEILELIMLQHDEKPRDKRIQACGFDD